VEPSQSHVALVAPKTNRTWEGSTTLLATQQETGRIEIKLNRPCIIRGIHPSVCPLPTAAQIANPLLAVSPSPRDIRVYIDISERTRLTSRFDVSRILNTEGGMFVSLDHFLDTTGGARAFELELNDDSPTLGFNFSWKRTITGGPWYTDCDIALALLGVYPDERF
jgi:hypothetical protein